MMTVELKPEEQELLQREVAAFLEALPPAETRERYAGALAAVESGTLPDEALSPIGDVLEAGLQTGRIRKMHRASGEGALLRLFGKTPAGRAFAEQTADVNRALEQLEGQTVETLSVYTRVPGTYLLKIGTDKCELTLRLGPGGAAVESVALGL